MSKAPCLIALALMVGCSFSVAEAHSHYPTREDIASLVAVDSSPCRLDFVAATTLLDTTTVTVGNPRDPEADRYLDDIVYVVAGLLGRSDCNLQCDPNPNPAKLHLVDSLRRFTATYYTLAEANPVRRFHAMVRACLVCRDGDVWLDGLRLLARQTPEPPASLSLLDAAIEVDDRSTKAPSAILDGWFRLSSAVQDGGQMDARLEIAINVVASELEESDRLKIAKRVDPMDGLRRHAWMCVIDSVAAAMRTDLRDFKLRFGTWPEQPFDPYGLPNPEVFPTLMSGSVLACEGRGVLCWIGRNPGIRFKWIKADEQTVNLAVTFWPRSLADFDDSLQLTMQE